VHTRLEAAGNLELVSRELMARAERLQGLRRRDSDVWRDSLWLLGRPRIWLRQSWLVADSIWIASREGRPDSTWLHGRVLLLEQDTLLRRWHQARAERMRAVFADTSLAALDLLEGAEVLAWTAFAEEPMTERIARARSDENRVYTAVAGPETAIVTAPNGAPLTIAPYGSGLAMAAQVNPAMARWKDMAPGTNALLDRIPGAYGDLVRE
jgi:hypothetical protein